MRKKRLTLFLTMLYISSFTFGGGFVIITMMKKRFVDELHWFTEEEMLDMTAIAQSSPGAIAVNASIIVGYSAAGYSGAAAAVLGTILPPMVILSLISVFYAAFRTNRIIRLMLTGMQAGVAAVILDVTLDLGGRVFKQKDLLNILILILAFFLGSVLHINAAFIVAGAAAVGVLRAFCAHIRQRRREKS